MPVVVEKGSSRSRLSRVRGEIVDLCQKHGLEFRLGDGIAEFVRKDGFICRTELKDQDEVLRVLREALQAWEAATGRLPEP